MTNNALSWAADVAASLGAGALTAIVASAGRARRQLARVSTRLSVVETRQEMTAEWLERVESKLDRAIEARHR